MTGLALVFRVGARFLAVDADEVAAVARRPPLTRVPRAPPTLAGVGALRGRTTPVIELARALDAGEGGGAQLIVLRGDDPVAFAVDRVEGLRTAEADPVERLDLRRVIAEAFRPTAEGGGRADRAAPVAPARTDRARDLSYLAFSLAGQRFAFALAEVRAVISAPDELASVPDADPVVRGLAPYGAGVLPVVELADLLGLPRTSRLSRLIVVEIGGAAVGLGVERVLGALRLASDAVSSAPAVLNRGAGEARLAAIARTSTGLTAILAADRLFDEATTRRLQTLAETTAPPTQPAAAGVEESIVVFRLGEERYGLPAATVEAVAKPPAALSAPPNAPPFLKGVMAHRGEMFPLVDLRTRFDAPGAGAGAVIFVRSGEIAAALLVTAVEKLARIPSRDIERAPPLLGDAGALFARTCAVELDGRPLLVADPGTLLGQARRDLVAWSARRP